MPVSSSRRSTSEPPSLPARNRAECEPYLSAATRCADREQVPRYVPAFEEKGFAAEEKGILAVHFPALAARPAGVFQQLFQAFIRHGRGLRFQAQPVAADSIHWLSASRLATNCPGKPASLEDAAPAPLKAEVRFSAPALRAQTQARTTTREAPPDFLSYLSSHLSPYTWAHCNSSIRRPSSRRKCRHRLPDHDPSRTLSSASRSAR